MKGLFNRMTRGKVYKVRGATIKFFFLKLASLHWIKFGSGAPTGTPDALLYINYGNTTTLYDFLYFGNTGTWTSLGQAMMSTASFSMKILLASIQNNDGTAMDATGAAGKFKIVDGGQGTGGRTLVSENANNNTKTDKCVTVFQLPLEYVAGSAITLRVRAKFTQGGNAPVTKTIDAECYKLDQDGAVGSDLCATAVQTLTSAFASYDFTITPTGLVAGDRFQIYLVGAISEAGAGGNNNISIGSVSLNTTLQG